MGSAVRRNAPALIEPVPVFDIFATSMDVEVHPTYYRIVLSAERAAITDEGIMQVGPGERVVVARLVIPKEAWHRMIRQAQDITGMCPPSWRGEEMEGESLPN